MLSICHEAAIQLSPFPIPPPHPPPKSEAAYLLGPLLEPASSFATTPGVMDLALRYPPRRVLNPGLLTKMAVQVRFVLCVGLS